MTTTNIVLKETGDSVHRTDTSKMPVFFNTQRYVPLNRRSESLIGYESFDFVTRSWC